MLFFNTHFLWLDYINYQVSWLIFCFYLHSPHTLDANELYQAHLTPLLAQTQSSLDAKLEDVEKENLQLAEKIARQRQEIQQLISGIETVVKDVETAASSMHEFDPDDKLREAAEQMDEEVRATQAE